MTGDKMTRDEMLAKVRKILADFVLPEPRLPYTEIDGSRLIKTPSGCVREDGIGRLYMCLPKSWLIVGRDEDRVIRKMASDSMPKLNWMLHQELEFAQPALEMIQGLKIHKSCRRDCSITYDRRTNKFVLDRDLLFVVSCTSRNGQVVRRFKEIS